MIFILFFMFGISSSLIQPKWTPKQLAKYANEQYKAEQYGVYNPDAILKSTYSILNSMSRLHFFNNVSTFLFLVNLIELNDDDDSQEELIKFASKLSKSFETVSSVKEKNILILIYVEEINYLAFHLGSSVEITKDDIKDINLQYKIQLMKKNFDIFDKIIDTIRTVIQKNANNRTTIMVLSIVFGILGLIMIIGITWAIIDTVRKRKSKPTLILTEEGKDTITQGIQNDTDNDNAVAPICSYSNDKPVE